MKITKYRPAFFSGFPDEEYEVNSKEELLASDLCVSIQSIPQFEKFVFRADADDYGILSSHFANGEHYVVAIIHNREDVATLQSWFSEQ